MKRLLITALLVTVGLSTFAQWDVRNKIFRQIANGDTIITRIWDGYDTYDGSNPIHVNYYDSTAFVGSRGMGVGGHFAVYDSAHVYGNTSIRDTAFTNTISPYSGTTTTFTENISVSGNGTIRDNLYLDTCSSVNYGVIYKGGVAWMHDYRPPFTSGTRPFGDNIFIGKTAGNFTMGSTATNNYESSNNIGIGSNSLKSLTIGYSNIAIGTDAFTSSTTSTTSVIIGAGALQYIVNTSGNTAIGHNAGRLLANGTNNTDAGTCVFLGRDTRSSIASQTNQIVIGYNTYGSGTNTVTLGNNLITGWYTARQLTTNTAGTNLIIMNGGATVGATDKGTMISLGYGPTTGIGIGSTRLFRRSRAASTGTTDNASSDAFIIPSSRIVANNSDSVIFTCTPLATDTTLYGNSVAGSIHYQVAVKGSNGYQSESGEINFTAVRYDGTVTATIGIDHEKESLSSSTLVVTPSLTYVGGLWTVTINVNSGLTSPVVKFDYTVLKGTSAPNLIQK